MPEPGFYFGAMFISYIFTAFLFLFVALVAMFGFNLSPTEAIGIVAIIAVLFFVYFFRLGRSIWIHINVRYRPESVELFRADKAHKIRTD